MTKMLYSHPNKPLSVHLEEVAEAALIIANRHDLKEEAIERLKELVRLHDFGKATTFFQDYITFKPNPGKWTGKSKDKVHTTLGALASTIIQNTDNKSNDWLLQLGASILGHHTRLPTRNEIDSRLTDGKRVLVKQLNDLPLSELEVLTGFSLDAGDFSADEDTVYDAADTYEELFDWLDNLQINEAVTKKLQTQLLFSILLEADKAFLALSDDAREHYKKRKFTIVQQNTIDHYIKDAPDSPVNALRTQARINALASLDKNSDKNIYTLTLPTGLGKTLTAASLALDLREPGKKQVIIVLPFLSIVDQTSKVYKDVLGNPDENMLMQSHSLSARDYLDSENGDADFLLDTWQSDIVITTFDQVLLALLSSKTKHQMRFHHLCDSVIIFDEIQALPTHLWDITQKSLESLSENFGSSIIAMSATQPGFVGSAQELIPNVEEVFQHFGRYQLVLKHQQDMPLTEFIDMIAERFEDLKTKRTLITLNTRASSRRVYDDLLNDWDETNCPIYFLTADVTPVDRLKIINTLRNNTKQPCLVISTQVVEAGVDIDMDLVIRDFAPLDSLIQVAGRCNRNNLKPRCDVEFYSLANEKGKRYSTMVYRKMDGSADISLQETRKVLEGHDVILEENILDICKRYFAAIRNLDNLGQKYTEDWAYFKEHLQVSKLLRGEQENQYQFIVAERDSGLDDLELAVRKALDIDDRWEKRRELRRLAPRLALVTVSVWSKPSFDPASVADPVGLFWFVRDGFYDINRGLDLGISHSDDSSFI